MNDNREAERSQRRIRTAPVLPLLAVAALVVTLGGTALLLLPVLRSAPDSMPGTADASSQVSCCPLPADAETTAQTAGAATIVPQVAGGFGWLFDTTGFPQRWNCGTWPAALGWLHIISDIAIWGAYMAIPLVLGFFVLKRRTPLPGITWLFIAFIATCGIGHLIEAIIFWQPVYRFAGVWKAVIATASWATVFALVPVVPKVLRWPSLDDVNTRLQEEIHQRRKTEHTLRELNVQLSIANQRQAMTMHELEMQKSALDEHAIVAITDTRGVITYVNDKFCEISGYGREELLGQTHRIVNSGHHPKTFFVDMWRTIAQGRPWRGEICNRAKDGSEYWVDTTIFPFRNAEGDITQYVAIRADITEHKHTEEALRHNAQMLELSNHELEEFVYTVSHDLKSPIVTIQGFTGLLEQQLSNHSDTVIHDCMGRISSATKRMQANIDDLLELSRVGRVKNEPEVLELTTVVQEVLDELHTQIDSTNATVTIENDSQPVRMDPVRLRQVLRNLIGNALKYGRPESGTPQITIGTTTDEHNVTIRVSDNGPGIDPAFHERVFGLFQRLQNDGEGTGVGLAIVKRIAEIHGGRAWVESKPGSGATLLVSIPKAGPTDIAHQGTSQERHIV